MDCNPPGSSMGLSRWEYWNGLPFPSPRNLSDPGIKHTSLALTGRFFTAETSGKPMAEDEVELIGQSSWSRSSPKVGMTCTKSLHEKEPVHQQSWKEPRAAGRERRKWRMDSEERVSNRVSRAIQAVKKFGFFLKTSGKTLKSFHAATQKMNYREPC